MIGRSLALKWIATLLLTSLVGVVLVGLFAYRTTVNEFDRLRLEQAQDVFVNDVATYYSNNGSWDGVRDWLHSLITSSGKSGDSLPLQLCALVDANGIVVLDSGPYHTGDTGFRRRSLPKAFPSSSMASRSARRWSPRRRLAPTRASKAIWIAPIRRC